MSERVPNWPNTSTVTYEHKTLSVRCTSCGAVEILTTRSVPPSAARSTAESQGWRISKKWRTCTCPACVGKEAPAPANDTQRLGMRRVIVALDDAYNEASKCYEDGWSDERIASDTGMSPEFVAKIREDYYGPVEDPRIADLRAAILDERNRVTSEVAELREMIDAMRRESIKRIDELGKRIAALTGER